MEDHRIPPAASSLIESLRDVGYDLRTALADVIDNSIAAKASRVDIHLDTNIPAIGIVDNGIGMGKKGLLSAMRHGSSHPRAERSRTDLGRFGLGLKTASLSQCRQLTVVSRSGGRTTSARWDNDYVESKNDWIVQVLDADEVSRLSFIDKLIGDGTMVLWQKLDRLSENVQKEKLDAHIYRQMGQAENYLELVFHRFLSGESGYRKIRMTINGAELQKIDPFNRNNPATQQLQEEKIPCEGRIVRVRPFILPHHKKVSKQLWDVTAGESGYVANQGFYVYRNGRLIIYGTWFQLAAKSELTKLARVMIDMPSSLDEFWKVDIKKASAQLPNQVRKRLRLIIERILESSKKPHTERGRKTFQGDITALWSRRVDHNEVSYEINKEHPSVEVFGETLSDSQLSIFRALMKSVEQTIPIAALYSDIAQNPTQVKTNQLAEDDTASMLRLVAEAYRRTGLSWEQISKALNHVEPFQGNEVLITDTIAELKQEETNER
jgi:hypothetical protein